LHRSKSNIHVNPPCFSAAAMSASAALDYALVGTKDIPGRSFLVYNVLFDLSSLFGVSPWHYHLSQTLPIMLTVALPFVLPTFFKALLGLRVSRTLSDGRQSAAALQAQDRNLRTLAVATAVTFVVYSSIQHKEWRFLHPLLPVLLLFGAHALVAAYRPSVAGGLLGSRLKTLYSGLRINKGSLLFLSLTPIVPWLYLAFVHGRGQVAVTEWFAMQVQRDPSTKALFLMPCHSTPWMSHIHSKDPAQAERWQFLTCNPPIA
jgi:phosphatidylinositol glycan class B